MFGPLMFPTESKNRVYNADQEFGVCMLCNKTFLFPKEKQQCLTHIFEEHKLVIADSDQIADLPKYLKFWKEKLAPNQIKEYCSTMLVDVTRDGVLMKDLEFFLLSDVVAEDKEIRKELKNQKIEAALEQQRIEREDTNYSHGCLFCRQDIIPSRSEFLTHLSSQHNVQLGRPENLVYVDKLISIIEEKMESLQCIFCEKYFKDRSVLKEHMRKKGHKRVNPNNQIYDQFYMINYLEPGKKWKESEKRDPSPEDDAEEPCDWSDWGEDFQMSIVCLFCEVSNVSFNEIHKHMIDEHQFDYSAASQGLDFYKQVKLVNYLRLRVYRKKCINCDVQKETNQDLIEHMTSEKHFCLPQEQLWNQPEYYFPTYENDAFLCQIDDNVNDDSSDLDDALNEIDQITQSGVSDS